MLSMENVCDLILKLSICNVWYLLPVIDFPHADVPVMTNQEPTYRSHLKWMHIDVTTRYVLWWILLYERNEIDFLYHGYSNWNEKNTMLLHAVSMRSVSFRNPWSIIVT